MSNNVQDVTCSSKNHFMQSMDTTLANRACKCGQQQRRWRDSRNPDPEEVVGTKAWPTGFLNPRHKTSIIRGRTREFGRYDGDRKSVHHTADKECPKDVPECVSVSVYVCEQNICVCVCGWAGESVGGNGEE